MLAGNKPSPEQVAKWRAMTGEQRVMEAERLYWEARELKTSEIGHQHPDWSEDKVKTEVNRLFLEASMKEE